MGGLDSKYPESFIPNPFLNDFLYNAGLLDFVGAFNKGKALSALYCVNIDVQLVNSTYSR